MPKILLQLALNIDAIVWASNGAKIDGKVFDNEGVKLYVRAVRVLEAGDRTTPELVSSTSQRQNSSICAQGNCTKADWTIIEDFSIVGSAISTEYERRVADSHEVCQEACFQLADCVAYTWYAQLCTFHANASHEFVPQEDAISALLCE